MAGRSISTRAVAAGAASVVVLAAMFASVGWRSASTWARTHPVDPAPVSADGGATVRGVTISFAGAEQVEELPARYGDDVVAPDGWTLWVLSFDVTGAGEDAPFGVAVSVVASDGATYTRSDLIGYDAEPEAGWLGAPTVEDGARTDAVLLPEGVEPRRVRVIPTDLPRDYWSFDA